MRSSSKHMHIDPSYLTYLKLCGRGNFGEVYQVAYSGPPNPMIEQFGSPFVIKKGQINNDIAIVDYINEHNPNTAAINARANIGLVASDGSSTFIITSLSSYNESLDSANVAQYVDMAVRNHDPNFVGTNLLLTLSQLAISMRLAQNALHELNILHIDTGLRNFVMNTPLGSSEYPIYQTNIIDLGLSKTFLNNGEPNKVEAGAMMPLRYLNKDTLMSHNLTILTDLFAMRSTLLELIGCAAGLDPNQVLTFSKKIDDGRQEMKPSEYALKRMELDSTDNKALLQIADRLIDALEKQGKKDLVTFLQAYKAYITHMPAYTSEEIRSEKGIAQIIARDKELFAHVTQAFNKKMVDEIKNSALSQRIVTVDYTAQEPPKRKTIANTTAFILSSLPRNVPSSTVNSEHEDPYQPVQGRKMDEGSHYEKATPNEGEVTQYSSVHENKPGVSDEPAPSKPANRPR